MRGTRESRIKSLLLLLSGLWFDLTGNYIATFLVNGGFGVFGGLLVVLVYFMMRRQRDKQQKVPIDDETYAPKAEEESVV